MFGVDGELSTRILGTIQEPAWCSAFLSEISASCRDRLLWATSGESNATDNNLGLYPKRNSVLEIMHL